MLGCEPFTDPVQDWGDQDFSKVVYIGDSYLSGFQDGALTNDGQEYSIAALFDESLNRVNATQFGQPMMPDNIGIGLNSKPWVSDFVHASYMGDRTDCEGTVSLGPIKIEFDEASAGAYFMPSTGTSCNLSFPEVKSADLFDVNEGNSYATGGNLFYNRVASAPGSSTIMADAQGLNPTFTILQTGMEDIFDYAKFGGYNKTIAPVAQFSDNLDSIMSKLPNGVIFNIPDVQSLPYFTTIPWNGADLTQAKADSITDQYVLGGFPHIVFNEGDNPFVIDDPNHPTGFRQMLPNEMLTIRAPLDSMKCQFVGVLFSTIPDQYLLDTMEVNHLEVMITAYNNAIVTKAAQYGWCVMDLNSYLKTVESGIKWNGVDFDMEFVSGGFFSLDGYHPNQKGYALITNQMIRTINAYYNTNLSTVTCPDCNGILFPN